MRDGEVRAGPHVSSLGLAVKGPACGRLAGSLRVAPPSQAVQLQLFGRQSGPDFAAAVPCVEAACSRANARPSRSPAARRSSRWTAADARSGRDVSASYDLNFKRVGVVPPGRAGSLLRAVPPRRAERPGSVYQASLAPGGGAFQVGAASLGLVGDGTRQPSATAGRLPRHPASTEIWL